jgi:hypothetical protein
MNRGYAFGFLLVVLVVILGCYVGFTAFRSTRATILALASETPATQVASATEELPAATATATITSTAIPAPLPGITVTLTAAVLPTEPGSAQEPEATALPQAQPTVAPTQPPAQPAGTPTPAVEPPTPEPAFPFRLASPPGPDANFTICCYIVGTVRTAAGVPLEGVLVQASNEWETKPPAMTKSGGEAGQYDIPLGWGVSIWDLTIVDADGNPISPKVAVSFDPNVNNAIRVDWQQTY